MNNLVIKFFLGATLFSYHLSAHGFDLPNCNKFPKFSIFNLQWFNQVQRISLRTLCDFPASDESTSGFQKQYDELSAAREKFYLAMSQIGNETDAGYTPVERRLEIDELAQKKAAAEIKLFAKLNGLENVLSIRSPIRIRVVKFPGLTKKIASINNEQTKKIAENPIPSSSDWANFSLQNKLPESAILELYLEDSEGHLHKFKTYNSQGIVGTPGPKLREGDFQVPEGEFALERPLLSSQRYISIGVDANPNRFQGRGSNIKIHGSGPSEGCIVLSNAAIAELSGYLNVAPRGKNGANVLITPFQMDKENYSLIAKGMNNVTARRWSNEMANHPELKSFGSLDSFWSDLERLNRKFENCRDKKERLCVSSDKSLPDEKSCLRHPGFALKRYVSTTYLEFASRAEVKKPQLQTLLPEPQKLHVPQAPAIAPPALICKRGSVLRWRVDYIDMGEGAAAGTYVIDVKNDEAAWARAKKEHVYAVKLNVKPFCMKLTSADGYYGD